MIEGDFAGQRKGMQHECDGEDAVDAEKKEECFIEGISDAVGSGQGAVKGDEGGDLERDGVVTLEFGNRRGNARNFGDVGRLWKVRVQPVILTERPTDFVPFYK